MWHYKLHKFFNLNSIHEWRVIWRKARSFFKHQHRKSCSKRSNLQLCMRIEIRNDWKGIAWSDLCWVAGNIVCKLRFSFNDDWLVIFLHDWFMKINTFSSEFDFPHMVFIFMMSIDVELRIEHFFGLLSAFWTIESWATK